MAAVKCEKAYRRDYVDVWDPGLNLDRYFRFYNIEWSHTALQKKTSHEVYWVTTRPSALTNDMNDGIRLNKLVFPS
jgi:hypothetical protein